ncbi:hypothetical protein EV214_103147 [Marinisporobacter balticus]|uniref:Uncharacterized protein n=1 Tax=Marinisporobacter balticus TaxID=2018667 RepID=A0A4R2LIE5_9FIRM|nr:hypothetical protein EV214_103147 [Marinisporobacter balticus]
MIWGKNKKCLSQVENKNDNKNYNVLMSFHLFLMLFLNKYGLEYHVTSKSKFKDLVNKTYSKIKIRKGLSVFLTRNKVTKEAKWIITNLKL